MRKHRTEQIHFPFTDKRLRVQIQRGSQPPDGNTRKQAINGAGLQTLNGIQLLL
ncbi:Uncharacterised protein [Shigella sonnei]|nr:Uncharacterised protein [Shigella sonnei]